MNPRQHALLVRALYAACGGVDECVTALEKLPSRTGRSQLYRYGDPKAGVYMPADVLADLEAYCGQPIYSQALCEARPAKPDGVEALITEGCDIGEHGVQLQALIRRAAADGITEAEALEIEAGFLAHEDHVRNARAALQAARS